MKKLVSPLIIFTGTFLATLLLQRASFVIQEYDGLFLASADYFTAMFRSPFPLSGIVGDFLSQFFRFGVYAPLIVAAGVTLAFLLLRGILGRLALSGDILPAVLSCALWIWIAFAPTAKRGVAAVLILCLLWAASRLLPKRSTREPGCAWIGWAATLVLTGGAFLFIALSGSLRAREQTASLRVAAAQSDWGRVLAVATPERCATDPKMMPYAFLALCQKGRLGEDLFKYPVRSRNDFDLSASPDDGAYYYFNTILYGTLPFPNEVLHNAFQLATHQDHGQSFFVLRRLLDVCCRTGDYALARKYAAVLSRSTLHAQYVRHFTQQMEHGTPREADSIAFRKTVPLSTHDPLAALVQLGAGGVIDPATLDRVLCSLLLQRDLDSFLAVFTPARELYPTLPRYYEEALVMSGQGERVSDAVRQRFAAFQTDALSLPPARLRQRYGDTFWLYYLADSTP